MGREGIFENVPKQGWEKRLLLLPGFGKRMRNLKFFCDINGIRCLFQTCPDPIPKRDFPSLNPYKNIIL